MENKHEIFIEGENIENLFSDDISPFLKSGMTWLFFTGIVLFSLTWFVKWPEVIRTPTVLTTNVPPTGLVPAFQSSISNVFFDNGDKVTKGSILITLENTSSSVDIIQLDSLINQIDKVYQENLEQVIHVPLDYFRLSNLGEMQNEYEEFLRAYNELKFMLSAEFKGRKISILNQQIQYLKSLNANLELQQEILTKEYKNAVTIYNKEKLLFKNGSITAYELNDFESTMLNKEVSLQGVKNTIIQNDQQQLYILEQKIQFSQGTEMHRNNFIQAFKNLKSAYTNWRNNYNIISPVDGIVSIPLTTQKNSVLSNQSPAIYIIPENSKPIITMKLGQYNLNAIDTNTTVRIKLTAYPYEEFGVLEGRIRLISDIPVDGTYETIVELTNGLKTTYNKKVEFINGMEGEAEIVLNNERLMTRLFKRMTSQD
jgi:multidrug resistance efflux pump